MIMWCRLTTTATLILMLTQTVRTSNWFDYGEESSNVQTGFDDDSDQYLSALTRDEEQEAHSPFITGYKYVSGQLFSF